MKGEEGREEKEIEEGKGHARGARALPWHVLGERETRAGGRGVVGASSFAPAQDVR